MRCRLAPHFTAFKKSAIIDLFVGLLIETDSVMKSFYLILSFLLHFTNAQASTLVCAELFSQNENLVLTGPIEKTFPVAIGRMLDKGLLWKRDFSASEANERDKRLSIQFSSENLDILYDAYLKIYLSAINGNFSHQETVNKDEALAIHLYGQTMYAYVNRALFNGSKEVPEVGPLIQVLTKGLQKLEPYNGLATRFLQINNIAEFFQEHQVGRIVTYKSFTSASKRPDWSWPGNVKIQIISKSGRNLKSSEEEILFLPNSRFEVIEVSNLNRHPVLILLKEIN